MYLKKNLLALFIGLAFVSSSLFAQQMMPQGQQPEPKEDYPKEELEKFINANKAVIGIQQESEQQMVSVIEEKELDLETFNKMLQEMQSGQESDADPATQQQFQEAIQSVMQIQQGMQQKVAGAVAEEGLDPMKYQEIMLAYQTYPKLQEKVNKMIEE